MSVALPMEKRSQGHARGQECELWLPYPPSANRYWRHAKGRTYISPEGEAFRKAARSQRFSIYGLTLLPVEGPVSLEVTLHPVRPKDWQRRQRLHGETWADSVRCIDLDNCLKIPLDALQGIAFENDKQVRQIIMKRGEPVKSGALRVKWSELGTRIYA